MSKSIFESIHTGRTTISYEESEDHGILRLYCDFIRRCWQSSSTSWNFGRWSYSSVLIGHNTLMKNLKILHGAGRDLWHLCFRPVGKTFHFWGDASSRSEWSIHLPVNIGGYFGRFQVFVIPGDTPFLPGRPVSKHFKIQIDYAADKISIDGGPWTSTLKGPREEYLINLHSSQ